MSTCQRWRSRILNLPGFPVPPGVFIPDCEQDGSFRTVQCLGSTGECWCVTKDGFMIWKTTTRGRPNCQKKGTYIIDPTRSFLTRNTFLQLCGQLLLTNKG